MLRRHYITQDQLEALQEEVACGGAVAPGPDDVPTGPQEPPPKVKGLGGGAKEGHGSEEAPPRQLSIADLKARQRVGAPSGPAGPRPLPSPNTEDASTQRLGSHPAGGGGPAQQAQPHHPPRGSTRKPRLWAVLLLPGPPPANPLPLPRRRPIRPRVLRSALPSSFALRATGMLRTCTFPLAGRLLSASMGSFATWRSRRSARRKPRLWLLPA